MAIAVDGSSEQKLSPLISVTHEGRKMGSIFSLTALGAYRAINVPSVYKQQAAAVCCRIDGDTTEVLLITGRGNDRWGIPKGTIEPGETSFEAAEREAFEEAGIYGRCDHIPIGRFRYLKAGRIIPYEAHVHILHVDYVADNFPEMGERAQDWMPIHHAAGFVARQGLAGLLAGLSEHADRHLDLNRLPICQN
jgi:8-oxo-dGTP pyrophosphatase MutT (NUDIX family)